MLLLLRFALVHCQFFDTPSSRRLPSKAFEAPNVRLTSRGSPLLSPAKTQAMHNRIFQSQTARTTTRAFMQASFSQDVQSMLDKRDEREGATAVSSMPRKASMGISTNYNHPAISALSRNRSQAPQSAKLCSPSHPPKNKPQRTGRATTRVPDASKENTNAFS